MTRIETLDLPEVQHPTLAELETIFGAGFPSFRPTLEALEDRQLMSASAVSTLGSVPVQFNLLGNGHLLMTQGKVQTNVASNVQELYQGQNAAGRAVAYEETNNALFAYAPSNGWVRIASTPQFGVDHTGVAVDHSRAVFFLEGKVLYVTTGVPASAGGSSVSSTNVQGLYQGQDSAGNPAALMLQNNTIFQFMATGGWVATPAIAGVTPGTDKAAASALLKAVVAPSDVANALHGVFHDGDQQVANALHNAGMGSSAVAGALQSVFRDSDQRTALVMHYAGVGASDIATALDTVFQDGDQAVANALQHTGLPPSDVATALQSVFQDSDQKAANAMRNAGIPTGQIASALRWVYNDNDQAVANATYSVGGSASDIATALVRIFGDNDQQVARVLHNAGVPVSGIAGALSTVFQDGDQKIASALLNSGVTASDVATALKIVCGDSDQAVATILFGLGVGTSNVATALKNGFGDSDQAVATILQGLGAPSSDVATTLENVFGDTAQAAATLLQGLGVNVNYPRTTPNLMQSVPAGTGTGPWQVLAGGAVYDNAIAAANVLVPGSQVQSGFISVTPGTTYTFSVDLCCEDWPSVACMEVGVYDANGNWLYNFGGSKQSTTGAGLSQECVVVYVAQPGDFQVRASVGRVASGDSPNDGGNMWVTNPYFGVGVSFANPPSVVVPFNGALVSVDASGAWSVGGTPFFPRGIYQSSTQNYSVYANQGFNLVMSGNGATSILRQAANAGMMAMVDVGSYVNPASTNYMNWAGLKSMIQSVISSPYNKTVLAWYWDNEEYNQWTTCQTMSEIIRTFDRNAAGTPNRPIFMLEGDGGMTREYSSIVDVIGDYLREPDRVNDPAGEARMMSTQQRFEILKNIEGQTIPTSFGIISEEEYSAGVLQQVNDLLSAGGHAVAYFKDGGQENYYNGNPNGPGANDVTKRQFWSIWPEVAAITNARL